PHQDVDVGAGAHLGDPRPHLARADHPDPRDPFRLGMEGAAHVHVSLFRRGGMAGGRWVADGPGTSTGWRDTTGGRAASWRRPQPPVWSPRCAFCRSHAETVRRGSVELTLLGRALEPRGGGVGVDRGGDLVEVAGADRKSTRLNSSHVSISDAV